MADSYVVITGCNRGIGRAIFERFAQSGHNIIPIVRKMTDSFSEDINVMKRNYNVDIRPVTCDFEDEIAVKGAAKEVLSFKVPISGLVNNVGISLPDASFNMTSIETIKRVFQINLFSPLLLTQSISRNMMKNRNGCIIFLSSTAAFDGGNNLEYSASKAAVGGV